MVGKTTKLLVCKLYSYGRSIIKGASTQLAPSPSYAVLRASRVAYPYIMRYSQA